MRTRPAFSLIELLVVIAIVGTLLALLLPAVQLTRESARATACRNNLKQIATAIHLYNNNKGRLPPARTANDRFNSTFLMLLPYLEEESAGELFDDKVHYKNSQENTFVSNLRLGVYLCPSMNLPREVPDPDPACSEVGAPGSYAVSTGSDCSFVFAHIPPHDGAIINPSYGQVTLARIADGTSNTLLVGELDYGLRNYFWDGPCKPAGTPVWGRTRWAVGYPGITWGSTVGRFNSDEIVNTVYDLFPAEAETYRSDHSGGANFAFVDGSVRFVSQKIAPPTLRALATRDGGERLDALGN